MIFSPIIFIFGLVLLFLHFSIIKNQKTLKKSNEAIINYISKKYDIDEEKNKVYKIKDFIGYDLYIDSCTNYDYDVEAEIDFDGQICSIKIIAINKIKEETNDNFKLNWIINFILIEVLTNKPTFDNIDIEK